MQLSDLDYSFPESLVAIKPVEKSRILLSATSDKIKPKEISKEDLFSFFEEGDALVVNETKVVKRKLVATTAKNIEIEVLFLKALNSFDWEVLLPLRRLGKEQNLHFASGVEARVIEGGLPQKIRLNREVTESFFDESGRVPLPPYIEAARKETETKFDQEQDESWYQTAWAKTAGSCAAPTASLHFTAKDIEELKSRGIRVIPVCLHVGLGTFLPVKSENLDDHIMHSEEVYIDAKSLQELLAVKKLGKKIWALGTTVCRSLESYAQNKLKFDEMGNAFGSTDLFIQPGYDFRLVDNLLTNFHQPKTTLLALVAAYSGLENMKRNYQWAIENSFRLFSYGDLSVWIKSKEKN